MSPRWGSTPRLTYWLTVVAMWLWLAIDRRKNREESVTISQLGASIRKKKWSKGRSETRHQRVRPHCKREIVKTTGGVGNKRNAGNWSVTSVNEQVTIGVISGQARFNIYLFVSLKQSNLSHYIYFNSRPWLNWKLYIWSFMDCKMKTADIRFYNESCKQVFMPSVDM
jgi:hypothetical protein